MPGFVSSIILSGVLMFVGGMIAAGAQKASTMGAHRVVAQVANWTALAVLLAALILIVSGIRSLPGEKGPAQGANSSQGDPEVERSIQGP